MLIRNIIKLSQDFEEQAFAVLKKHLGHHLSSKEEKLSLANRKKTFLLISKGSLEEVGQFVGQVGKGVVEFGKGVGQQASDVGKGVSEFTSKQYERLKSLLPGEEKKEKAQRAEAERAAEEEKSRAFKSDTSLYRSVIGAYEEAMEDSGGKYTSKNYPPSELQSILAGYKRVSSDEIPSDLVSEANNMLSEPLWTTKSVSSGGIWYLLLVELHHDNHPDPSADPYWHKGVSVFYPMDEKGEDKGETEGREIEESEKKPVSVGQEKFRERDAENYLQNLNSAMESGEVYTNNASVVRFALNDVGKVKETSKNWSQKIEEYFKMISFDVDRKVGVPWCAAACSAWLKKAGVPITGSASAHGLEIQFDSMDSLLKKENFPTEGDPEFSDVFMPGNIVFITHKSGDTDHVGVLKSVNLRSGQITTIDGNSGSDGKQVAVMNRSLSSVKSIGLVSLIGEKFTKVTD